jgi:hypothetical protein
MSNELGARFSQRRSRGARCRCDAPEAEALPFCLVLAGADDSDQIYKQRRCGRTSHRLSPGLSDRKLCDASYHLLTDGHQK